MSDSKDAGCGGGGCRGRGPGGPLGVWVPEYTLFTETCNRLTRTLTYDQFRDLLSKARDKRRADSQSSEDGLKWGITPDGLFRLRQMP